MKAPQLLVYVFVLFEAVASGSFYDNPEQDPLPLNRADDDAELSRKWDFEVRSSLLMEGVLMLVSLSRDKVGIRESHTLCSGLFPEYRPSRICHIQNAWLIAERPSILVSSGRLSTLR